MPSPQRHYHSTQHLAECLHGFETVRHLAQRPAEVALALWFHDAVYERAGPQQRGTKCRLGPAGAHHRRGAGQDAAERVYELVMATRHTSAPAAGDAQLC